MACSPFLEEILNVCLNLAITQYISCSRNHGSARVERATTSARQQARERGYCDDEVTVKLGEMLSEENKTICTEESGTPTSSSRAKSPSHFRKERTKVVGKRDSFAKKVIFFMLVFSFSTSL